jgi:quinol monooxygenase YgiN
MSTGHPSELAVVVTLRVRPGMEDEFLRLLTPVLDAMRHEPTFVTAALHRSPDDPTSSCSTRSGRTGMIS